MAPLPALRCSPGWECMAENGHKRGQSFDSGLAFKNKDDDLGLFNDLQKQELDNFLLHTADDFEESISKLRHFSDFKLGINIPTRGEGNDLLNLEGDKNDYDWLLTPPDTPLFPSLDDTHPQPVNHASRGRAREQVITSKSLTDKRNQTSRTSSSPNRLSPSRTIGTLAHMRGRPSSVPRSGPPLAFRSATPTRRSSAPPNKHSKSTPRSSTLILQRPSTGSSIQSSIYGKRGPSPMKENHGNSASPKVRGWQMNLPGFTSEAPPNLRTSLIDRPVFHTRGSSPASANGRESSTKHGRKSMSPSSSGSISSFHCQERDCFSSYSKCSMASSGDDNEGSLHSIRVGISRSSPARKDGALASSKTMSYSRKPFKCSPTNSIPKKSFDSALRLMDQCKIPRDLFRPLLSSVPATTFRPNFSRNSSLTTSSNASSEQGVFSAALDGELSGLEPTEIHAGWERSEDSEAHEEVFLFDKVDEIIEDSNHDVLSRKPLRCDENFGTNLSKKFDLEDVHIPTFHIGVETRKTSLDFTHFTDNHCGMDGRMLMSFCSRCMKEFKVLDSNENISLCQKCAAKDSFCTAEDSFCTTERALTCVPLIQNTAFLMGLDVGTAGKRLDNNEVPEFHEVGDLMGADCLPNICSLQLLDKRESELSNQQLDMQRDINVPLDCCIIEPQLSNHAVSPSLKVDIPEGTGISLILLHRSGSSKWPILQGKTVSAANILRSEPSYLRDNINYMQKSTDRDNASASSSVDLESSRQKETFNLQRLCREGGVLNMRNDIDGNAQSKSLPDDLPMNCYESGHLRSECEQTICKSRKCLGYDSLREIILVTEEHDDSLNQLNINVMPSSSRPVLSENLIFGHTDSCLRRSTFDLQNLNDLGNDDLPCSSGAEIMCNKDCTSSIRADEYSQNNGCTARNLEGADISGCSEMEEDYSIQNDGFDAATKSSSIMAIEVPRGHHELEDCYTECISSHNPAYPEEFNEHSISQTPEKDISLSTLEPSTVVRERENHECSGIVIEHPRGSMPRSLTLEEATDTILFCSSIIHDLAYRATTIGMEKELNLLPEARASFDPTMTNLGKPIPGLRESWKMSYAQTQRSHKFKRKRMESQTKSPHKEVENDVCTHELTASRIETPRKADTAKPPKLESKCNCIVL